EVEAGHRQEPVGEALAQLTGQGGAATDWEAPVGATVDLVPAEPAGMERLPVRGRQRQLCQESRVDPVEGVGVGLCRSGAWPRRGLRVRPWLPGEAVQVIFPPVAILLRAEASGLDPHTFCDRPVHRKTAPVRSFAYGAVGARGHPNPAL